MDERTRASGPGPLRARGSRLATPLPTAPRQDAGLPLELPPPARAVAWRSIFLAVLLIPLNAYWLVQMERVRYSAHPTTVSLFFNVVFILLVLALANAGVARVWPRAALTRGELLVVYAMLAVASTLAAHDMFQILVPMLAWPYRFATSSNRWEQLFFHLLPKRLMVPDPAAMRGFFGGNSSIYVRPNLLAWLVPGLLWCAFTSVLLYVML